MQSMKPAGYGYGNMGTDHPVLPWVCSTSKQSRSFNFLSRPGHAQENLDLPALVMLDSEEPMDFWRKMISQQSALTLKPELPVRKHGDTAQQLRELSVLQENRSSVPSTHTTCNSSSRRPAPSSGPQGYLHPCVYSLFLSPPNFKLVLLFPNILIFLYI